jgi:hypothetical protein
MYALSKLRSRRAAEDTDEPLAHALLGLGEMGVEGGEVGHVGGPCQQAQEAAAGGLGPNGPTRHKRRIWPRS